MSYQPLVGVKVLDLGILIPAALTSGKLAALGADVVKVEQPPAVSTERTALNKIN